MDGKTLTNMLNQTLEENSTSSWIDLKTSYDYLYEAACEFVRETECLTATQSITPVASTATYDLNADYLFLYLLDDMNQLFLKYNDGTNTTMLRFREYGIVAYGNQITPQVMPDSFSIIDKRGASSNVTGSTTADGAAQYGECVLTDSGATFLSSVSVGDIVHNVTDDSHGVVVEVTSNTALITALFGGTNSDWTTADGYIIVLQGRKQLLFSAPFSSSGGTITVEYVQRPTPVYSLYRSYRFNQTYSSALVKYAAWLYKYRDREPSFADAFYKIWDNQVRRMKAAEGKGIGRRTWRVNFNKRSNSDRAMR